MTITVVGARHH